MKTRYIPIILIFALVAFLLWWRNHRPVNQVPQQPDLIEANQSNQSNLPPPPIPQHSASTSAVAASEPTPESDFTAWNEKRLKQMKEALEKGQDEWRTPIEFYGEVVDENTNPVAGAQVDFVCNDTSAEGTSFYHNTSDDRGLFALPHNK